MRKQRYTLAEWRRRYGLSRRELAQRAALAHSTIWRIEHNRHSPIDATRRALALALGGLDLDAIIWPVSLVS